MSEEVSQPTPESYSEGEKLYRSFSESLSLVRAVEKKYVSAVLGVPEQAIKDTLSTENFSEIRSMGDRLEDLFFGQGDRPKRYDEFIDSSLSRNIEDRPVLYTALTDPDLAKDAKRLVRMGMVAQLRQKQVELAREDRAKADQDSSRHTSSIPRSEARKIDDLILFNHTIRELIESPSGLKMNLNREKVLEIINIVMPGDRAIAEAVEKGISLEVASKHLLERIIITPKPEDAVIYGSLKDDKEAGDLILFPNSGQDVMLDIKQTAPNKVRIHLSDEQLRAPGSFIEPSGKAVMWLGSGNQVSNNFRLPNDFLRVAEELVEELAPVQRVA